MNFIYNQDTDLVKKISEGDKKAWNTFVETYSRYVFFNISKWCFRACKPFSNYSTCATQDILKHKKVLNPSNSCEEGLDLYVYIFDSLKGKILKYQGKSSLKTYITACLNYIYSDFFIKKHGKINIPTALENLSEIDKKVYRVLCKSKDLENAIEKLDNINISKEQTLKSFELILQSLKKHGNEKAWQHLYSNFFENQKVEPLNFTDEDGNEIEKDLPIESFDYINHEILEYFSECFFKLEPKYQRLLKLKFDSNLSIKEILAKYASIFKFKNEQEVYYELEKAIKSLVENLSNKYEEKKVNLKEFKESLYDIFKLI